jgi:hypothetical protein
MVHSDRYLMWSHVYVKKKKKNQKRDRIHYLYSPLKLSCKNNLNGVH